MTRRSALTLALAPLVAPVVAWRRREEQGADLSALLYGSRDLWLELRRRCPEVQWKTSVYVGQEPRVEVECRVPECSDQKFGLSIQAEAFLARPVYAWANHFEGVRQYQWRVARDEEA